jgi:hypothetical protein
MTNPPKLHSFVYHKRHAPSDMVQKVTPKTYVNHYPESGDMLPSVKLKPRSYVDHFAKAGDLRTQ